MKRPLITLAILWGLFTLHLHYDARRAHEAFVELAVQLQDTVTALQAARVGAEGDTDDRAGMGIACELNVTIEEKEEARKCLKSCAIAPMSFCAK